MHDDELDALLRRIPDDAGKHEGDPMQLDDGLLIAYRDGTLSPEQTEAVEKRLAIDPGARLLLRELSAPVTPDEVDALMARVDVTGSPRASVVHLRRRAVWTGAAVAALAAGVLALVWLPSRGGVGPYQLEVEGGDAAVRGSAPVDGAPRVMGPDAKLVTRLRAERATDDARVVGVFVSDAAGKLVRVRDAQVASSRGSFEVTLRGNAWLPVVGVQAVWFRVARDEAALDDSEAPKTGDGWWRVDVERRE